MIKSAILRWTKTASNLSFHKFFPDSLIVCDPTRSSEVGK